MAAHVPTIWARTDARTVLVRRNGHRASPGVGQKGAGQAGMTQEAPNAQAAQAQALEQRHAGARGHERELARAFAQLQAVALARVQTRRKCKARGLDGAELACCAARCPKPGCADSAAVAF